MTIQSLSQAVKVTLQSLRGERITSALQRDLAHLGAPSKWVGAVWPTKLKAKYHGKKTTSAYDTKEIIGFRSFSTATCGGVQTPVKHVQLNI